MQTKIGDIRVEVQREQDGQLSLTFIGMVYALSTRATDDEVSALARKLEVAIAEKVAWCNVHG